MPSSFRSAVRRLAAFAVDWFVVAAWGAAVFGAAMLLTGGKPERPNGPWTAQAVGFLTMTLPVVVYFAACESSARRASFGKRALGLEVAAADGRRLTFAAALVRNAVKFLPWECGHLLVHQAMAAGDGGVAAWVWAPAAVALVVPPWWAASLIATGRTPYDRWTSTSVAPSSAE